MRRIAICLLIALSFVWFGACQRCFAQQIIGRPMLPIPLNTEALLPGGIKFRWRASDLSTTPVSLWTDSVSGNSVTASGTARPAWSTNGVAFDGTTDQMTLTTNITVSITENWLIIHKWDSLAGTTKLLGDSSSIASIYLGINTVLGAVYFHNKASSSAIPFGNTATFDFLACKTTEIIPYQVYTNGVSAWSNAIDSWNSGRLINAFGGSNPGVPQWFPGVVKEIIVWTNAVFTPTEVGNIHSYSQRVYGVTP